MISSHPKSFLKPTSEDPVSSPFLKPYNNKPPCQIPHGSIPYVKPHLKTLQKLPSQALLSATIDVNELFNPGENSIHIV